MQRIPNDCRSERAAWHLPSAIWRRLTAADCYRFALSNRCIDVALCGPRNDEEMTHALSVLRTGPMNEQELSRARAIGHHVHEQKSLNDWFR